MHLLVVDALAVLTRFGAQALPLVFLNDHKLTGAEGQIVRYPRGTRFDAEVAEAFRKSGLSEADFVYTEKLHQALATTLPERYRFPFASLSFVELDKTITALVQINRKSGRVRTVLSQMELYRRNGNNIEVLLGFGEEITAARWNALKAVVDKRQRFDIRYSECGIIVFVDLRPQGENFLQRFYRNSDLVTSLVGHRHDERVKIAPDFVRELDVFTVDDPGKLLDVYQEKNARLIIIGDALSDDYKTALARVKHHDPFARFLMATNIDQGHLDAFLLQVRKTYLADNYNIDDY